MSTPSVRVLVVDDEEDLELLVRQKFRRRIRKKELDFLFANNGMEALDALEANPDVHLVLSDINMPVMDGLSLLNQLSSIRPDVQAVIVSAYGDMTNIRTAMNRGAFDFLTKPIDFNDLEITIEKTIKHVQAMQLALESRDRLVAIKQELEVARQVQDAVQPKALPATETHQLSALIIPAREIGGDFYDYFYLDDRHLGIVIADVAGKGVPAALFTMVTRALLKASLQSFLSPSQCLSLVNELVCEDNDSCTFITLFFGVLDFGTGKFDYSNAGHNPPRLVHPDGKVEELPQTGNLVLGIMAGHEYKDEQIQMNPGDTLFLYTDGVTEAEDAHAEEFGEERMDRLLSEISTGTVQEITEGMILAVQEFVADAPQSDDITCLAMRLQTTLDAIAG